MLCFRNFLMAKKFMDKKGGGGLSKFSVENFLSQNAEKFRTGNFYLSFFFGYRKCLCFRGLCHDFLSKFFVSQYRNLS